MAKTKLLIDEPFFQPSRVNPGLTFVSTSTLLSPETSGIRSYLEPGAHTT